MATKGNHTPERAASTAIEAEYVEAKAMLTRDRDKILNDAALLAFKIKAAKQTQMPTE